MGRPRKQRYVPENDSDQQTETKKNIDRKAEIIKKGNSLIRASYRFKSIWESRIIALIASKIRVEDEDFKDYEISVKEICRNARLVNDNDAYKKIEKAANNLVGKVITFFDSTDPKSWEKFSIMSYIKYDDKEKKLKARFDPVMKPFLLNLQEKFTKYNLSTFYSLNSTYSQRLYEILKSWANEGAIIIELEKLHIMLNSSKSYRNDYRNFKRSILNVAQAEINETTDLFFIYEPIHAEDNRKKIDKINFIFVQKPNKKISDSEQKKIPLIDENFTFDKNGINLAGIMDEDKLRLNQMKIAAMKCSLLHKNNCTGDLYEKEICDLCKEIFKKTL